MVVGGEKRKPQNNEGDETDYRMKIKTEKLVKIFQIFLRKSK
jgi:hypothetical protein